VKIFVAMSGGVDSSVAALLLRRAGHEVVGVHLRTGVAAEGASPPGKPRCCGADEAEDARRAASLLGIPFFVQNAAREFEALIGAFADAYASAETPNPCVRCNAEVKFGALLRRARALGADAVATGHYARRVRRGGRLAVARAIDRTKDQSYVLYALDQEELERAVFPLGELSKAEVRALAREAGLGVADKPESQEICFVPSGDYRTLVRARRPDAFAAGAIVDEAGRVLGTHGGVGNFTVGQRRGLGLSRNAPLYVLALDPATRRVRVGPREALGAREAVLREMRWSAIPAPDAPLRVEAVLRYRARAFGATVEALPGGRARLVFAEPAWPLTPGQAAVLYDGDVVLGGGTITADS
jgi:tRNA-specific 2-thiouridylase